MNATTFILQTTALHLKTLRYRLYPAINISKTLWLATVDQPATALGPAHATVARAAHARTVE